MEYRPEDALENDPDLKSIDRQKRRLALTVLAGLTAVAVLGLSGVCGSAKAAENPLQNPPSYAETYIIIVSDEIGSFPDNQAITLSLQPEVLQLSREIQKPITSY